MIKVNFAKYDNYKNSGVEWLGDIPEHWEVKPLKSLVQKIGSGKTPKGGAEVYSESGIVFIRSQNVHFNGLRLEDVVYIDKSIDNQMASTRVFPSDILLNITGASLGRCTLVPDKFVPANVNQHVCIIRPISNSINPAFLNRVMSSDIIQRQIFSAEYGTSREGLTFAQIRNFIIGFPQNISEQKAIARYLDEKTELIDRKINLLTEKAERYKELKRSLINKTVTCGLDQSVPMKNSGIEWLGDIPEHWEIKRLKELALIKGGKDAKDVSVEDGEYPIYGSGGIFGRSSQFLYSKPSVLLGRKGTIDKPLFVIEPFWTVDTMYYTEIQKTTFPKFLHYLCLTIPFGLYQYGSAVPSMTQEDLRNILFTVPQYDEQKAIALYLDEKTSKIDQIIETINNQIEKLQELRKTLINDIVTGKIKVI